MSEELQTVFEVVIRAVNYVRKSPLRGRLFTKLCDDMEAELTVLLYYSDKCFRGNLNWEKMYPFYR
jgi:hypothetical protein